MSIHRVRPRRSEGGGPGIPTPETRQWNNSMPILVRADLALERGR